jgi:hypothetical protein
MKTPQKIHDSVKGLTFDQTMNITYELLKSVDTLSQNQVDRDFLELIPIRLVAANESFFKDTIGGLIDQDIKYFENAKRLTKKMGVRIDLDEIFYLTKSKYSIGELISYSLKYSSIDTIISNYNEITGIDIYQTLEQSVKSIIDYDPSSAEELLIVNSKRPFDKGRVIKNINELYEIRNVIAHDFNTTRHKLELTVDKIKEFILDNCLFIECVSTIGTDIIYSNEESEKRINELKIRINEKHDVLKSYYSRIRNGFKFTEQESNFLNETKAFDDYFEKGSLGISNWYRNHFLNSHLYLMQKEEFLDQRIAFIEKLIKYCC